MEFLDHQSELRSQIDNKAFTSVQTASGGGVFLSVHSLPKIVELAPTIYHDFVVFIGLNGLSFLLSLIGILIRRETNRRFSQAKMLSDKKDPQAAKMHANAWNWSNLMWGMIISSVIVLSSAYVVLIIGLYSAEIGSG